MEEYEDKGVIAKRQLESLGIQIKQVGETFKFVIPRALEKELQKVYNFSIKELTVGGDITLPELARHVDEQAAMEARAGSVSEFLRHEKNQIELEYEVWYNKAFWKAKQVLDGKPSDKAIHSYIVQRYSKKWKELTTKKNEAEFAYRLMNNAIRAAWITKGRLLQTLRVIVQGSGNFSIGEFAINAETGDKSEIRIK